MAVLDALDGLDALDADAVRAWSRTALERLTAHRGEIDALNVFPVPDADTGSNLVQTIRAADTELHEAHATDAAAGLAAMATGAARAAVGNSGFIVSQVLRGFADAAAESQEKACGAETVRVALERGAVLARTAVVNPIDGTMLTVARAAADGAAGQTLAEVVRAAALAADVALQATPDQLAELAAHGVVDAGGRGLVLLLDALVHTVTGADLELLPVRREPDAGRPIATDRTAREAGSPEFAFEVQYRLDASQADVETLRGRLSELGDSVAVVPLEAGAWKVHVHVNDVGAAFEAGVEAGRPHQVEVVRFADQHQAGQALGGIAVVAVAPGAGLAHLFETEGVFVVEGGPGEPPSPGDVLTVVHSSGAPMVVLLPNASQVTGVAEAAAERARADGLRVSVVPTRSPVQGLAAIAVHDASRAFDDDVVAMAEAAAATRFAEITVAESEGLTAVGRCQPGDVLGLIDGEVVEIGRGLLAVAFVLVDRLLGVGAELMTIVVGGDAPVRAGDLIEAHVRGRSPFTDVTVYHGGQSGQPVIIGVE